MFTRRSSSGLDNARAEEIFSKFKVDDPGKVEYKLYEWKTPDAYWNNGRFTEADKSKDNVTKPPDNNPRGYRSNSGNIHFTTQPVTKPPSETEKPEDLMKDTWVVYTNADGKTVQGWATAFPPTDNNSGSKVELKDGEGNPTGTVSKPEYLSRGVEFTYNWGVEAPYALCQEIYRIKDSGMPAPGIHPGECDAPFCLCQMTKDQIRFHLGNVGLSCVDDLLRGDPHKGKLCAAFQLLQNAGLIQWSHPWEDLYAPGTDIYIEDDDPYGIAYYDDDPYDDYYIDYYY